MGSLPAKAQGWGAGAPALVLVGEAVGLAPMPAGTLRAFA